MSDMMVEAESGVKATMLGKADVKYCRSGLIHIPTFGKGGSSADIAPGKLFIATARICVLVANSVDLVGCIAVVVFNSFYL